MNKLISNPIVDVYVHAKNEMFIASSSNVSSCCLSEATSIGDENQYLGKYGSYGPYHCATNE